MSNKVFFSWQSDRSTKEGRNLIERALQIAVKRIAQDITVEETVRDLEVDKDTKDVPGSPPIFQTILNKIDRAAVFVPDLTFVCTGADDRLTPNPNVLIEYGWALKSLGYSFIVPVMNTVYGKGEDLPFDLKHLRFPITYNLSDGASDDIRRQEREQLAQSFETALKAVFGSEEFKAKLPRKPDPIPFKPKDPLDGRARFRPAGEPIGVMLSPLASLTGSHPGYVHLSDGPAMWLRVTPTSAVSRTWKIAELERAINALVLMPLCGFGSNLYKVRGEDGFGIYGSFTDRPHSNSVVYAFITGEVWVINAWFLDHLEGRIVLEENKFAESLELCANFLDRLGIPGPYHWIAGMEGVKDRYLLPENSSRGWGPCMMDIIEKDGVHKVGESAAESLRPFFEEVYDQCGRPT